MSLKVWIILTDASTVLQFFIWFQSSASACSRFAVAKFAKSNDHSWNILENVMFNVFILKEKWLNSF